MISHRIGELYHKVYAWDNLYLAYQKARRNKRYRGEVLDFSANLEERLIDIQNHLIWKSYEPGRYRIFQVHEPKERTIMALPFRDRVCQHALHNIIEPIFDRTFINDSYACRHGRGLHRAMLKTKEYIRSGGPGCWILKADVRKFFANIDHEVLKTIIRRKIKCKDTLWLIDLWADHHTDAVGLPIGNLTSQLFANITLGALDHHVKEELGIKGYCRYMDDFILITDTKDRAKALKSELSDWIEENLHLSFNEKTQVIPERNGVDFVGYHIWHNRVRLRRRTVRRLRHHIKKVRKADSAVLKKMILSLHSWRSMALWGGCRALLNEADAAIALGRK